MKRIVIAGGGLAAQRAAESLRALGHDGPLTMLAAEPRAPYDRPPLSKAILAGETPDLSLRPPDWHADNGVELLTATPATGLDHVKRRVRTPSGDVPYDELLIATGATPVTLPGLPHAQALRTLDDALELAAHLQPGARIAVVGAGLIGQEIASAAAARDAHATLIDVATRPFDALMGPGQGDWLRARHEHAGVELLLGRRLTAAAGTTLVLDDGTRVTADRVVVAIGVRPDLGWTGLRMLPRGIHAAGDCTGSAHWEAAVRQGQDAARAILGLPPKAEAPPLVWSDQHGARIQRLGDPAGADAVHREGSESEFVLTFTRAGRPVATTLVNRPGEVAAARRALSTRAKEAA
jgi:3-phenylpropionate/trans-cinnamate dioxygenase ferredoxin reductase subunit